MNDFDIVVRGTAAVLSPFADRMQVVEVAVDESPDEPVDVALFDTFGSDDAESRIDELLDDPGTRHVAVYSWDAGQLLWISQRKSVSYISKSSTGPLLADAIQRVAASEHVIELGSEASTTAFPERLSTRETETLVLLSSGLTNAEIARVINVSAETVKTYVERVYQKIGARNRADAAARAARAGLTGPTAIAG